MADLPSSIPNSHEYFEELCCLAAGGHLSFEEQERLEAHLTTCESCLNFYQEMLSLTTKLSVHADAAFAPNSATTGKNNPASTDAVQQNPPKASPSSNSSGITRGKNWRSWSQLAAAILLGVLTGASTASLFHNHRSVSKQTARPTVINEPATPSTNGSVVPSSEIEAARHRIQELEAALVGMQARNVAAARAAADSSQQNQRQQIASLLSHTAELDAKDEFQRRQISVLAAELEKLRQAHDQQVELLQARDARIRLLTADLVAARAEENVLEKPATHGEGSGNTSVAELLGQRNLHVIDVYDENNHGQRTAAFGRVFYGEGSSLLFYAFDLPVKLGSEKVVIQAWGQQEGSAKNPIKLGILTQSDPSLPRWALRVKNPAQLSKIDAVYVTMERREEKRPSGQPMLYAYLRQAPNHP